MALMQRFENQVAVVTGGADGIGNHVARRLVAAGATVVLFDHDAELLSKAQAEIAREYLTKGRQIYVEGSLQTRQWDDKEGQKRYTTEIRCQRFVMLGGRGGESERPASEPEMPEDPAFNDENIPF